MQIIETDKAPAAIGSYSQAVKTGNIVFISGQIPLEPASMTIISETFEHQAEQVFKNLSQVCQAAGGSLSDLVKLTVYLTDLNQFETLNQVMSRWMKPPFPARAAIQVSALPKNAQIEIDGMMEVK